VAGAFSIKLDPPIGSVPPLKKTFYIIVIFFPRNQYTNKNDYSTV